MTVESFPDFSPPARRRWESIPADFRQRLLVNVWCGHCRRTPVGVAIQGGGGSEFVPIALPPPEVVGLSWQRLEQLKRTTQI